MVVMALFQLHLFAKCLVLGEDGPWAGASVSYGNIPSLYFVFQVFTPLPATYDHVGPQVAENEMKMFVPAADMACPPYTQTLKGIIIYP